MSALAEYEATFDTSTKVWMVFCVLRDGRWHCRQCEYAHVGSTQIAGGSGIQGLQRGTASRPGLEIESGDHLCVTCGQTTRQDRWQGNSHNLLKSRACERCYKTGNRGEPFGIRFYYAGDGKWATAQDDPAGCVGCGWYDFDAWRSALNRTLRTGTP